MQSLVSSLGLPWIAGVVLLATRIAAALLFTPLLHAVKMPAAVRVLVVIGIACVLAMPFASRPGVDVEDTAALVSALLREAVVGATLGLGILMAFAGFSIAGRLVDRQMGFVVYLPFLLIDLIVSSVLMALGMMMLPPTQISLPIKVLVFVLVDGWALVLRALVGSFH